MAQSNELGTAHEVEVPGGRIRYRETGEGPPVVFLHGLMVNGDLWRKVVPPVAAAGHRCLTPDLPLGAHEIPVPGMDLSPAGLADTIAAFLAALNLDDVTLVANDTAAGITQFLMTRESGRVGRVVLATGDCYDRFPPPMFAAMPWLARIPGSMGPLAPLGRSPRMVQRGLVAGKMSRRPVPLDTIESYARPLRDPAIRADLRRFLKGLHKRDMLATAQRLGEFTKPVLLAWAADDMHFPLRYAQRLAADLPDATLETIEDTCFLVPEDQPELLAEAILAFTVHSPSLRSPVEPHAETRPS